MKNILLFLFLANVALINGLFNGFLRPGLRVTFGLGLSIGSKFFYDMPEYIEDAVAQGWTKTARPVADTYLPDLEMYCFEDKVLCTLYDDTGYVAGVQVAINPEYVSNNPYGWESRGFVKWSTSIDGQSVELYAIQQYLVDEEFLSKSKEERLASRDSSRTLQAGGVWVVGHNRELLKIPTNEAEIKETNYKEQDCFYGMGDHYFYNMTSTLECTAEQLYPWFALTNNNELVGTGPLTFGTLTLPDGARNWFETPTGSVVRRISPYGPDCLYDTVDEVGLITVHIYYVNNPWWLNCL